MQIGFGPFAFDARHRLLRRGAAEVALPPRVLGVLELLLERAGDIVPRQELMDRVWRDAFVTDTSLAEAVSVLRQSLGDDPQAPTYIQTVHRRGYRFVAPVTRTDGSAAAADTALARATPAIESVREDAAPAIRPSIARDLAPWSIAVLAAALAIAAVWRLESQTGVEPLPVARFEVHPAAGTTFDTRAPALAVAPDGRTIAWTACDGSAPVCGLYVRPLNAIDARRLAGTDGAEAPFFSPDGRWVGFFADGKLKKVAVAGGSPVTLADAPSPGGGSWSEDGRIVFGATPAGGLWIASDQGGEAERLTAPAYARGELRHVWPAWIDAGRAVVFTVATSPIAGAPGQLAAMNVPHTVSASPSWHILRAGISRAIPGGSAYLLATTGSDVRALTFDERTLTLTGAEDTVIDDLATASGLAQVAVGRDGTLLALRTDARPGSIFWSDDPTHPVEALARLTQIVLTSDGRRAAGVAVDASGSDIWTVDLSTGGSSRITFGGDNVSPAWSADGRTLLFSTRAPNGLFTLAARGAPDTIARLQGIPAAAHVFPHAAAPDRTIAAVRTTDDGHLGIVLLRPDAAPQNIGAGPVDDTNPVFSPDGALLAYESDETGRSEVYVQPVHGSGRRTITTGGGSDPLWSADGRTVYYRAGATLVKTPLADPGSPQSTAAPPDARVVAVAPSGRMLVQRATPHLDRALIVLGWLRELRQRIPLPLTAPR